MKNIKIIIFMVTNALKLQRMYLFAINGESRGKQLLTAYAFTVRHPVVGSVSMFMYQNGSMNEMKKKPSV
jgi:hypothetical protein